ncbi:MAG: putative Co/Zn/Cd efflux system rane fusion protein [Labilithrix sp.]|nr:putative Co/Zn/Cd efflux system rane fusion protein [Labilithrix sp.]
MKPLSSVSLSLSVAVALGAVAAGCSSPSSAATSSSPDAGSAVVPVAHVDTAVVVARQVPRYLAVTGQLKSGRETDLAANAAGRVLATNVERGSQVKAGDVLATLDVRAAALSAAEAKAQAETAAANAANAKTECDRTRALVASGALGRAELDRADGVCKTSSLAVSAAQARSQLAAQNVGDGVIRAPFAGVVAERYVDVGEFVHSDSRVITLVDLSALRLELTIPETNIAAARPGAKVIFGVAGYPERTFTATLAFVGASVRATTRDVVAEAKVDATDALLRPGMFASGRIASGEEKAPVVPKSAVVTRDGKSTAFVVVGGRIEQRIVQVGEPSLDGRDELAIARGIQEGESVVLAPNDGLRNGTRVAGN